MSNFTNLEASIEVQDFTIAKKSIAILLWLYMQFVSNPLLIGICQFEKNGGDPLKRRITDQVSSFSDCILILDMLYLRCFPAVFKLFDNLDHQSHLWNHQYNWNSIWDESTQNHPGPLHWRNIFHGIVLLSDFTGNMGNQVLV